MSIQTAYSTTPLPEAVAEVRGQVRGDEPRFALFFASDAFAPEAVSREMQKTFPDSYVIGCSTAGEIAGGRMLTGSLAAFFWGADEIEDASVAVVENLTGETGVRDALTKLERHFGTPASAWGFEKYLGIILVDGMSGAEERLMEKLGDLTDVFFIGGSAGDDLKFRRTHVYAAGRAYSNAAVLAVLRMRRGFEIVKTQSFRQTGKTLVATAVDEPRRAVIEFNHRPALEAYAEALEVAPAVAAAARFFKHPLGLMVLGEPFVRSPQRADGNEIVFYCQIKQGMELEVLEAGDIVEETRQAIERRKATMGKISGMLDFQCILRTLQLRNERRCADYTSIFDGVPMVGFSTYGEAYLGHLNQTSTIVMFR